MKIEIQKIDLNSLKYNEKKKFLFLQSIQWFNNDPVIELFLQRPNGLLPTLDDESKFPKVCFPNPSSCFHDNYFEFLFLLFLQ